MPTPYGSFIWYELMTSDAEAAEAFYTKVVGWKAKDSGLPGVEYTLLSAGDAPIGGLMKLPDEACEAGARPGWLGYLAADKIDQRVEELKKAGAKIIRPPEDIPQVGRFAVLADPQGAVFCMIQGIGGDMPPAPPMGTPGHIGWHELHAVDGATAFDFYGKAFGWTKAEAMDMGEMGIYQIFNAGPKMGGMMRSPAPGAPFWMYYFNVDGIDAAIERVKTGGGQIVMGPQEVPGGAWIVNGIDPQGAFFALVSAKR